MNCPNCKAEMVKLRKWVPRLVKPFEDVTNTTMVVTLAAFKKVGTLIRRTESDVIYMDNYACSNCGLMQSFIKSDDLKHVLRTEEDSQYE